MALFRLGVDFADPTRESRYAVLGRCYSALPVRTPERVCSFNPILGRCLKSPRMRYYAGLSEHRAHIWRYLPPQCLKMRAKYDKLTIEQRQA